MNRQQLYHAIRAAGAIAGVDRVIIVGSQAILGSFDTDELPAITHMSAEVDVMPDVDDFQRMVELSDLIEGVGGELSPFEELHGFALDGVDLTTSILPLGWRDRLVEVSNEFTQDPVTGKQYTGLCLDPADLCVANSAPDARRTEPSSPRSSIPSSSSETSSSNASNRCHPNTPVSPPSCSQSTPAKHPDPVNR